MHSAYLCLQKSDASFFARPHLFCKTTYSELTIENSYQFLLCTVRIHSHTTANVLENTYRKIAAYFDKMHIHFVYTNLPDDTFYRIFYREFHLTVPSGEAVKRLLYIPLFETFSKKLSLPQNATWVFAINYMDDRRKAFFYHLLSIRRDIHFMTQKPAAMEHYVEEIYAQTGCSIHLDAANSSLTGAGYFLFDFKPSLMDCENALSLVKPKDSQLIFANDRVMPLLGGMMDALSEKEVEFLLASQIHKSFPTKQTQIEALHFRLKDVISHLSY